MFTKAERTKAEISEWLDSLVAANGGPKNLFDYPRCTICGGELVMIYEHSTLTQAAWACTGRHPRAPQ
jgi:hypothetical protein